MGCWARSSRFCWCSRFLLIGDHDFIKLDLLRYARERGNIGRIMDLQSNKNAIDEIDQRIIEALQQDGRRPFTKIAADLGISEASVRQRVSHLINTHVMQIVAVTNPVKLGFSMASMIGIRVSGERLLEAAEEIATFDEVIYLILCTGRFDLLAEVVCRDNDHFLNFLTEKLYKVPGVQLAESYTYLRVCKQNDWAFLSQARLSPSPPPRTPPGDE
jgi:Lrp/AsnC family transcriptional regulator, regulator for asnA, asnC and gidA